MDRVAIVGPGGAGKSTFARELGARTGLPVIHLDEHYWKPGWVETPRDGWRVVQAQLLAGERWIADGNYGATLDERFRRADTVIVIDPGRWVSLAGALRRALRNHGRELQAPGCPERLDLEFLRWVWNYDRNSRPRLDAALARHGHLRVIELTTHAAMGGFLAGASA